MDKWLRGGEEGSDSMGKKKSTSKSSIEIRF